MSPTAFTRLHPFTTFYYFVGAIILAMILQHPVYLTFSLFISGLVLIIHKGISKQLLIGYVVLFFLIVILNPIFVHKGSTILFTFHQYSFTLEALLYGVKTGLFILIMFVTFSSFNQVITSTKLLFLFSRYFPKGAMLLALALRFVPLFITRIKQIDEIQVTKGLSVKEGTLRNRAKAGMLYVQVLLSYSLEEALQTADSMKARGYTGNNKKRSTYHFYLLKRVDIFAILFLSLCLLIAILGRIQGYGDFIFFPESKALSLNSNDFYFLVVYIFYIGFPVIMEGGSMVKWHLINLKTSHSPIHNKRKVH